MGVEKLDCLNGTILSNRMSICRRQECYHIRGALMGWKLIMMSFNASLSHKDLCMGHGNLEFENMANSE